MADWIVEQGIGEERALLMDGGSAIAAMVQWPGSLAAGQIEDAVLSFRPAGSSRGRARFASGEEALVDRLPQSAAEGAPIRLEITRAAIGETARIKLAHARPTDAGTRAAPSLMQRLKDGGEKAALVQTFPTGEWEDIWAEAWAGTVEFSGGSLHFSATPAMVLIDVDGHLPPRELALAAVLPIARAIRRFGLAGSIGVDFPTLAAKADRKAVDSALEQALASYDHERTAMNGFGFVQIVSRFAMPSLLHLLGQSPTAAAARFLMRQAQQVTQPGVLLLSAHPAVIAVMRPEWQAALVRSTGRELRMKADPALAIGGGFAQAVSL